MSCQRRLAPLVLVLLISPVHGQNAQAGEALTLTEAIAKSKARIAVLQARLPGLIEKALKDEDTSKQSATVRAILAHHEETLRAEIADQRLLTAQLILGKELAGKGSIDDWLAHLETTAPRLPKAPPLPVLPDFSRVDQHVLATPPEAEKDVKTLAAYLGKGAKTDWEKARAIFMWLTNKIAYDYDAFNSGKLDDRVDAVLESRRAVCSGYAKTFEQLGLLMGLQVGYATGHFRKLEREGAEHPDEYATSLGLHYAAHGWNVVKIEGKTYIIDATHAAGLRFDGGKTTRRMETDYSYFMMPPEIAIVRLIPKEERWQSLKPAVKKEDHELWPLASPNLFTASGRLVSHPYPVAATRGQLLIELEAPPETHVFGGIEQRQSGEPVRFLLTQRQGTRVFLRGGLPKPGAYQANVTLTTAENPNNPGLPPPGQRIPSAVYRIEASEASPETPKVFRSFIENKAYLYHPLTAKVRAMSKEYFVLAIPKAEAALIKIGEQRIAMQKRGDLFLAQAEPVAGAVQVFANFGGGGTFHSVLEFTAE